MKHVKLHNAVIYDDEKKQELRLDFLNDLLYISIDTKNDRRVIQETNFRLTAEEAIRLAEDILNRYKVVS